MIKELRKSRNMTQDTLASALGVQRTTISMWETGQSLPRAELLPKLAAALGCTIDELLSGNKENENNTAKNPMLLISTTEEKPNDNFRI